MIAIAKTKGCYTSLKECTLGLEDYMESLPFEMRGKYDFAVGADFLNTHFVSDNLIEQILFSLKPNGICVMSSQFSYMGNFWYYNQLEDLEAEGRIRLLEDEEFFRYDKICKGIGKYSKTPAKVYGF